jgi:transcriptional regulator with PAS, ATPase and Fis domain
VVPLDEYVFPAPIPELHDNVGKIGIFSEKMERIYSKLRKLQEYPRIPVLISGETGTGKEVIAKYLHYENSGIEGQFIAVNCATLNDDLFSSELFGYEEGSFTGARRYGKAGKIELARGGTLFLDEITEISIENQAKLLRVIEEREYYKVGGSREFKTDTRFVFASNRDLKSAVQKGFFRKDLYHRLSVCQVTIPPLRERKQEIGPLTVFLLQQLKHHLKKEVESIEKNALKLLKEYSWPGNIRELKNILTHILIFEETTVIREKHINSYLPFGKDNREKIRLDDFELPDEPFDLEEFTRTIVRKTLGKFRGNKTKTAKFLGLSRGQLYRRYRLDEE